MGNQSEPANFKIIYRVGGRPGYPLHRPRYDPHYPLQDGAEAAQDVDLGLSADPRSLVPRQQ